MRPDDHPGAILVVDDDDFVRMLVKAFLERAGYTVLSATDGASGLDFFQQNRTAIALLLTDVAMPNMNGLDLADRVLELDRKLPVLFMSGTAGRCRSRMGLREKAIYRFGAARQGRSGAAT